MSKMTSWVTCLIASCVCMMGILPPANATCGGLEGDVVFVLDASGSVGSSDFQTMLSFVSDLIDDFDIGTDNVRVGVVAYASSVSVAFNLNAYTDKTTLKNAVMSVTYTGGVTYTGAAISAMTNSMFTSVNGDRSDVPNVGIVITDGASTDGASTITESAAARAAGVSMFSIGVGTGLTELNAIASDPDTDHVFTVTNFAGLTSIEGAFQAKACTPVTFAGCSGSMCLNGGSCVSILGATASCLCASGYSGAACQISSGSASEEDTSNAAAIAGGVVGGVAAVGLGVAALAVVSKVMAGKTAVSTLQAANQANVENGPQSQNQQEPKSQDNDNPIPGMTEAPSNIQPADTRWPARLPPLNRY